VAPAKKCGPTKALAIVEMALSFATLLFGIINVFAFGYQYVSTTFNWAVILATSLGMSGAGSGLYALKSGMYKKARALLGHFAMCVGNTIAWLTLVIFSISNLGQLGDAPEAVILLSLITFAASGNTIAHIASVALLWRVCVGEMSLTPESTISQQNKKNGTNCIVVPAGSQIYIMKNSCDHCKTEKIREETVVNFP